MQRVEPQDAEVAPGQTEAAPAAPRTPAPQRLWHQLPCLVGQDPYGYGRHPAFWFTLNCPYNYLYDIHRFQGNTTCFHPTDRKAMEQRWRWCLDNPDIVCFLHAVRVELLVRMVMPTIVPVSDEHPFHYWVRFEEGPNGNPHAHGMAYAAKNP